MLDATDHPGTSLAGMCLHPFKDVSWLCDGKDAHEPELAHPSIFRNLFLAKYQHESPMFPFHILTSELFYHMASIVSLDVHGNLDQQSNSGLAGICLAVSETCL